MLVAYQPSISLEIESKARMLKFLTDYKNPFSRDQLAGHFTASAFVLNSDMDKFLLMHHAKLDLWVQPGGHCDGDEDVLMVALKEAQEESGIKELAAVSNDIFDIDVHMIPGNAKTPSHYHYDVRFLLKAIGDDTLSKNEESKELRWIDKDLKNAADIVLEESILRMMNKVFIKGEI